MNINKNLMSINHTALKRNNNAINFIVVHYVGALGDAKANTDYYKSTYVGASADFWVGFAGDIWQGNDYRNYYSWHCGGGLQSSGGASFYQKCTNANSVGIEMCVKKRSTSTMNATDKDWYFLDATIKSAAELVAYLMKDLDIDIDHVIRHYDVNGKICPNPFVYDTGDVTWVEFKKMVMKYYDGSDYNPTDNDTSDVTSYYRVGTDWKDGKCVGQIGAFVSLENAKNAANNASMSVSYKVYDDNGKIVYSASERPLEEITAENLKGMSEGDKIAKVAPLYQQCQKDTGMLASVGLAQFCLESGYGTTDLALNANNMHGMKCSLSGNTWANSTWDGKSQYTKQTAEQDANGNVYYVIAAFRKYPCIKDSIYDRAAYFIGAKNGNVLRYPGINAISDYKEQIVAIKNGGYATDVNYISKLTVLVQRWGLDKYDLDEVADIPAQPAEDDTQDSKIQYYVRKSWDDIKSQIGAYEVLANAKNKVNENWEYNVYDGSGVEVYNGASALVDRAVDFAIAIANDNSHGYTNGKWGPEYSCISYVEEAYNNAGLDIKRSNIDKMPNNLKKVGFIEVTDKIKMKNGKGAVKGDIFWKLNANDNHGHTELFIGDGKFAGARGDTDGKPGDSKGDEISVIAYTDMGWQKVFRLPGAYVDNDEEIVTPDEKPDTKPDEKPNTDPETPSDDKETENILYLVQAGAFTIKSNAVNLCTKIKNTGFEAYVKEQGGMYKVQTGAYSVKANAQKQVDALKSKGFDAIIANDEVKSQYVVQCGAFSKKTNANVLIKKLKSAGYAAVLKTSGNNYIVQAGVFENKSNANKLVKKLKNSGFDAIIK